MGNAFLITFKPESENPERGMPEEDLNRLAVRCDKGEVVRERWRFLSKKACSIGDRTYLLQQGKKGPAIIGYGSIAALPSALHGALVEFEKLVRSGATPLVDKDSLRQIPGSVTIWNTQASGIRVPEGITRVLEELIAAGTHQRAEASRALSAGEVTEFEQLGTDTTARRDEVISVYVRDIRVRAAFYSALTADVNIAENPVFSRWMANRTSNVTTSSPWRMKA